MDEKDDGARLTTTQRLRRLRNCSRLIEERIENYKRIHEERLRKPPPRRRLSIAFEPEIVRDRLGFYDRGRPLRKRITHPSGYNHEQHSRAAMQHELAIRQAAIAAGGCGSNN